MQMYITVEQLNELTEVIEDTIEYFCDQNMKSGQLAWIAVESLAQAKLAELNGELAIA